jgi:preprotein translocase subunit SecY
MFSAFTNIAKIPELRKKALVTVGLLALSRLGVFIPLPDVNTAAVESFFRSSQDSGLGQFLGILNMFSGGGLRQISIFALGIMPYISASIVFQLATSVVPSLQKVAKEGESGRRKINQWTRYSTVALCLLQAMMICSFLQKESPSSGQSLVSVSSPLLFILQSAIIMAAGTAFLMWLGEQIDEFGLGNGMSLIIMIGIISQVPVALEQIFNRFDPAIDAPSSTSLGPGHLFILMALFLFMVVAVVYITEASRRIPMQTGKRTQIGFRQQHYLPLKINNAGVIAIIFAQALLILPSLLAAIPYEWLQSIIAFVMPQTYLYQTAEILLIVFFSFFYTAVLFNPKEQAENFKQYNMFIPGIRPGPDTRVYLERVINRITFAGSIFIAIIAVVPNVIQYSLGVNYIVSGFYGGTGLLIVVGVALDCLSRIESHLIMERYEGFLKSGGRIRGRRG